MEPAPENRRDKKVVRADSETQPRILADLVTTHAGSGGFGDRVLWFSTGDCV